MPRASNATSVGSPDHSHCPESSGERAGLVGRDQAAASERLHGREVAHHHAVPRHAGDPDRQGHRECHGQTFRNRRDRQRDRTQQHLVERLGMGKADQDQEPAQGDRDGPQAPGEALHAA
jgi:hypothetical protein